MPKSHLALGATVDIVWVFACAAAFEFHFAALLLLTYTA